MVITARNRTDPEIIASIYLSETMVGGFLLSFRLTERFIGTIEREGLDHALDVL
jgi:hypothetical protein